ncbi:hypothetical protein BDV96DRAFT_581344 [Lophiotrema nucula]|uniref:Zn(2)-C6 fungal-type domain-containing protein n=1 Tax=Lophiotrema nucula TaxID=690887 RepID=A0A6A5Z026_9PLEO|nr:hypothetical protein BDV96DRAFT_581344 [Lophiotrema nucula]
MSFTPSSQGWQSPSAYSGPTSAPPMPAPTSAPQPSKSIPERKAKLRASCDACAASKVKCSKEHPICARCTANGSQCIYGVSRKHGKPGRTRKKNPDGTPFIKGQSKQRPSPNGSGFDKFRIQAEPLLPDLPEIDESSWSSTPEWTPEWSPAPDSLDWDYQLTPNSAFSTPEPDFSFMDDILMTSPDSPSTNIMQTIEPEQLTFRDPFAKKVSMQIELPLPPDFQALQEFVGSETVNPLDYGINEISLDSFFPQSTDAPESPKGTNSYFNPLRASISMPVSHCCYSLAYTTVESLHFRTPEPAATTEQSLDSVLTVCKDAVQNVIQMLACPCSSDPHLAMLYSSITSKVITWYQIAAGLKPAVPSTPSLSTFSSPSSSNFSSPLSTPSTANFNVKIQPLKIGVFEFDEADQEALTRQVVLRELKKCGALVDKLAQWQGGDDAEQAEFLYDVLGAWLKSELYKTLRDVTGGHEQ